MKFTCYEHWNDIPPSCLSLFEEAEKNSLFFSHQWFENLVQTALKNDQKLLIACVIEDEPNKESHFLDLTVIDHFDFIIGFIKRENQTFSQYLADRPSKVRNTIARKQRKLTREHGYKIHMYKDGDVEQALADYHALYKVSWKANEQYEEIVRGFVDKANKAEWLRLGILYIADKPIAAHLWFTVHRKASIFRLVYDQDWKQYSPGSILMSYMMEYAIDVDNVEEIDFLTGNDRYKQDWMSERRERSGITFVKRPED
ncbi:hypothetical protein GQR58_006896 [Nymphon striatum]|nr:hypothetical protein GQR58_006896 [Nymphon striatum]